MAFAATTSRASRVRTKILVIEDHADAAESMRVLLELLGHEVRVCHDGADGVAVARKWVPHVVLSDLGLPGLDGFAVAQTLRRTAATAACRLIAISGYCDDDTKDRCREAGFDQHFPKPVDLAALGPMLDVSPMDTPHLWRGEFQP